MLRVSVLVGGGLDIFGSWVVTVDPHAFRSPLTLLLRVLRSCEHRTMAEVFESHVHRAWGFTFRVQLSSACLAGGMT